MSVRDILTWPDPMLGALCAPVKDPSQVAALVEDLFDTMYAAQGRGLAAPQIGVAQRVFVMDAGWKTGGKTPLAVINPVLRRVSDTQVGSEGCLSMPGVTAGVTRGVSVEMAFSDETGAARGLTLMGAAAVIAQHEADHLDGVMHIDRLTPAERVSVLAAYEAVA